jgi:RNA polymerase sigma factor (sigma-70 family)
VEIEPININELKTELENLHASSFGWAMSCCRRDRELAEEVLQTVYLKIFEGKAVYRGDASLKTWLFAVIRKTAISEYRRRLFRFVRFSADDQTVDAKSSTPGPATTFEKSEEQLRFQKALKELPRRQREALHLVFYEDITLREAADVMGISIGSARTHYERGKKRLRETLAESEVNYGINWRRKENPGAV